MPQEFLASFAVDINEGDVDRLQLVLKQNKELAVQVSEAFDKARTSILEYLKVAPSDDRLSSPPANETPSGKPNSPEQPAAGNLNARDVVKNTLLGELFLNDGTERGYTLDQLLYSTIAMGTRNASEMRKFPLTRSDYGLPAAAPVYEDEEDYSSFQYQAKDILSKPIEKAREMMQQALDAETQGLDTTEYTDKVIEILREPLQQVQELYDSLTIGGESGEGSTMDFSDLSARVDEFLKESAKKKMTFSADASDLVSTASAALSRVRSMVENANLTLHVKTEVEDLKTGDDKPDTGLVKLATGGRFSSPTHAEIAEDGDPEYVIPVKKEDEALPLVRSLLSELSASARESLRDVLVPGADVSSGSTVSGLLSALPDMMAAMPAAAAPVVVPAVASNNVSAPVNIHVEAAAADPVAVGHSIYNTAERYLLRTLQTTV